MGVLEQLNRKSGVIVGDDVLRLFEYAKEKQFAIPAIVSFLVLIMSSNAVELTLLERHLFLHRCRFSRGCSGPELPRRSADLPGWCRLLRR
jgi:hypothetical protein